MFKTFLLCLSILGSFCLTACGPKTELSFRPDKGEKRAILVRTEQRLNGQARGLVLSRESHGTTEMEAEVLDIDGAGVAMDGAGATARVDTNAIRTGGSCKKRTRASARVVLSRTGIWSTQRA